VDNKDDVVALPVIFSGTFLIDHVQLKRTEEDGKNKDAEE